MQSKATTVDAYLKELPEDRRAAISAIRDAILKNLNSGFEEGMQYGMIGYFVPHCIFPEGYHCDPRQPLPFVSLASQKNHMSLYLMCVYMGKSEAAFRKQWMKTGKKLDMGKSCVRFKKLDDVALDVVTELISSVTADEYIKNYQASLTENAVAKQKRASAKTTDKKSPTSSPTKKAVRSSAAATSPPKTSKKSSARKSSGKNT